MSINLRNALMAGKRLPYDAEVEYLESTGTQYIDTGVVPTAGVSFEITAAFDLLTSGRFGCVSTRVVSGATYTDRYYFGVVSGKWAAAVKSTSYNHNISTADNSIHDFKITDNGFYIDNGLEVSAGSLSITNSFYLFDCNGVTASVAASAKMYSCKIRQNGVLVRDFIPVRVGTVGYLYDRVSGKLFGNAGTGDFVLGPDVVPVEYIESHGTQWIDTGTPAADKYVFECLFTNATRDMKLFGNSFAYGRYRDLSIYQSRYRGTNIATSSNEWDRIEIDVTQPSLTVTRNGSTFGPATSWWSAYTGATPDTQYGTALPLGGHVNAYGTWYGSNKVTCFSAAQGVSLRTRLFESWSGSEPIEKLISVRVGTEGAMMDVLTRRIYRNAGTGAFTYGNDLKYPIPSE